MTNPQADINQAIAEAGRALKAVEKSHMRSFDVYSLLKFGGSPLTAEGKRAVSRLDEALTKLVYARESLVDAEYDLQRVLEMAR